MTPAPDTQTPTTDLPEALEADEPGWTSPRRQPATDPLDPTVTTERPGPETDEAASLPGDQTEDEVADVPGDRRRTSTSRGPGPSPASTDPGAFLDVTSALVGIASLGVHHVRRAPGTLWIADDEDVAGIAGPLSRIAARHSPIGGAEASDLGDGLAAAVGVASYVAKNAVAEAQVRAGAVELGPDEMATNNGHPPPPA